MNPFKPALDRVMADKELAVFLVTIPIFAVLIWLMAVYFPVLLVGILIAYLLDGLVTRLSLLGAHPKITIPLIVTFAIVAVMILLLVGVPQIIRQLGNFATSINDSLPKTQIWINDKLNQLPSWFSSEYSADELLKSMADALGAIGTQAITIENAGNFFTLFVYVVLMPLLVFFLMRDKHVLFSWIGKYIPQSRIFDQLYTNLQEQFGAYVRGKIIEAAIVFTLCIVGFSLFGLNYAFVLSVAIGLSVIIPFVGAVAVTFPVLAVAGLQFSLSAEFWYVLGFYLVIQAIDGQLIVPLLFSEIVKIHPIALLAALVVFGSIWGIWGVFFAIPLASLIKSILLAIEHQLAEKKVT